MSVGLFSVYCPEYAIACSVHYTNLTGEIKRAMPHLVIQELSIYTNLNYGHYCASGALAASTRT